MKWPTQITECIDTGDALLWMPNELDITVYFVIGYCISL